jgi:predicted deacylase
MNWHMEVTQAVLRRYSGQDAQAAFAARAPYDAIVTADIRGLSAELHGMLMLPPPMARADHRQIERLLRGIGVTKFTAKRHGHDRALPTEKA